MFSFTHKTVLLKILEKTFITLPSPSNISFYWNWGSLLGLCLISQILSGLLLAIHYSADASLAFESVSHISRDVSWGWLIRASHANTASFFFLSLYLHAGRGMFYESYFYTETWLIGVTLLLLTMATAFLGYVLPWGQMSFWGATVITNLFSAIPYIGKDIVYTLWGGFAVSGPTLTRFFTLHFLLPLLIAGLSLVHLLYLHQTGSSNPLGVNGNFDKVSFSPYFIWKDVFGMFIFIFFVVSISCYNPWLLGDPENFIEANPLVTPVHIQPEWYFLFAYAILRAIPSKLGGVIALFASVLVLYSLPFGGGPVRGFMFLPLNTFLFWILIMTLLLLTWLGACPVEAPYMLATQILSSLYFSYFFIYRLTSRIWVSTI